MSLNRANSGAAVSGQDPGPTAPKRKRKRLNPKRRLVRRIAEIQRKDLHPYWLKELVRKYGDRYPHLFPMSEQTKIERCKAIGIVFSTGLLLDPRRGVGFVIKE